VNGLGAGLGELGLGLVVVVVDAGRLNAGGVKRLWLSPLALGLERFNQPKLSSF